MVNTQSPGGLLMADESTCISFIDPPLEPKKDVNTFLDKMNPDFPLGW